MKLWVTKPLTSGANDYYRSQVPARVLEKLGLVTLTVEDHDKVRSSAQAIWCLQEICRQDIVFGFGRPTASAMERTRAMMALGPARGGPYNEMIYPPTVIWSIDDNFHYVDPLNPVFIYHGTRVPGGKVLEKGDKVGITLPNGEEVVVWEDGKQYGIGKIDFEENVKSLRAMDAMLRTLGGVSFTTERLRKFYEEECGYPHTYTFPNSILFDDYNMWGHHKMVREDAKSVRVMWQGGDSHYADWTSIRSEIGKTCRIWPNLKWVIWGTEFHWVHSEIPDEQFEHYPWVPYGAFRTVWGMMDFDFMVCPLVDNVFNQGKSAIKFYEAAARPDPKPVLAARVPPYSDEIVDGETGLLYSNGKEFLEKFGALVENPDLRARLARRATEWVREYRDAYKTTLPYFEWIMSRRNTNPYAHLSDLMEEALGKR